MKSAMKTIRIFIAIIGILCSNNAFCGTQSKYTPDSMKTWQGFFDPKIGVKATIGGTHKELSDSGCGYVFPTFVTASKVVKQNTKSTDVDGIKGYKPLEIQQMCAWQTSTCSKTLLKVLSILAAVAVGLTVPIAGAVGSTFLGIFVIPHISIPHYRDIGCIDIPIAPPPAPFCDVYQASPLINVVPVFTNPDYGKSADLNTLFSPKIKVIIGYFGRKECNDGTIIPSTVDCRDGSVGAPIDITSQVLNPKNDGKETSQEPISYGNIDYYFSSILQDDKVCAKYYGNSKNQLLPISFCYQAPALPKPIISQSDKKFNVVLKDNYGTTKISDTLSDGGKGIDIGNYHLKLIKPSFDDQHHMHATIKCIDASGDIKDLSSTGCPDGYSTDLQPKKDNDSKISCLSGWNTKPSLSYVVRTHPKDSHSNDAYKERIIIKETPYGFVQFIDPNKKNPGSINILSPKTLYISQLKQSDLDTIRDADAARANTGDMLASSKYTIKYEDVTDTYKYQQTSRMVMKDSSSAFTALGLNENDDFASVQIKSKDGTISVTKYLYVATFIDEDDSPFLLSKDELNRINNPDNPSVIPVDPLMQDLCLPKFTHVDYTDSKKDYYYTVNSQTHPCDFVKLELWGGGGSPGYYHKEAWSGGAGGYISAYVHIDKSSATAKRTLKIHVGSGGPLVTSLSQLNTTSKGATYIELCDQDKNNTPSNCNKILTATAGSHYGYDKSATQGGSYYINDANIILYPTMRDGLSGKQWNGISDPRFPLTYGSFNTTDEEYSNDPCSSAFASNEKYPGMGGCLANIKEIGKYKYKADTIPGNAGKVRLTCEALTK